MKHWSTRLLCGLLAGGLAAACSDDTSTPGGSFGAAGDGTSQSGAPPGAAGASLGGASAGLGGEAGDAGRGTDAVGGESSAGAAGAWGTGTEGGQGGAGTGAAGAGVGGVAAGQGGAFAGAAGATDGGAPASCAALHQVPLGSYELTLTNVAKTCLVADLSCSPDPSRSGEGPGTLALVQSGTDGSVVYIDGTLTAPTLNLDGLGAHAESYAGMLVNTGNGWEGGWDSQSEASIITLWGDTCFGEFGEVGKTLVTIERSAGAISSFARHCETHYATFWYDLTTTGTGALVCQ